MLTTDKFINEIEKYDKIVVLRHIHPDYDALGSQAGIIRYLQYKYPSKDIRYGGYEDSLDDSYISNPEKLSDEWVKQALCIVVDASTLDRIDGKDIWDNAAERIFIDHHMPGREPLIENSYVDPSASSCAEIIAFLLRKINNNQPLNKEAAEALYSGLISDSIRFSINTTSSRTLAIASYLTMSGLDLNAINVQVFSTSLNLYKYANHLREVAHYEENGLVWALITKADYEPYNIDANLAKTKVSVFGEIEHVKTWVLFVEETDGNYGVSLRSHKISIREIANEYGGGGHNCASGIPSVTESQCHQIVDKLNKLIDKN